MSPIHFVLFLLEKGAFMRVFVACSGDENVLIKYRNLASDVATSLVRCNHKLIFGGSSTGCSGKCYMTYRYEAGKIKAIIDVHDTKYLEDIEVDAYEVMPSSFEKNKMIYQASDMILILPGGLGEINLLFSLLEESKKRNEKKPIILFNYDNYYTPLLRFLESAHNVEFLSKDDIQLFSIVNDIKSLERYLKVKDEEWER